VTDTPPSGVTITVSSRVRPWTAKCCRSWRWRRWSMVLGALGGSFGRTSTASTAEAPHCKASATSASLSLGPRCFSDQWFVATQVSRLSSSTCRTTARSAVRSQSTPRTQAMTSSGKANSGGCARVQRARKRSHHRSAFPEDQATGDRRAKGATVRGASPAGPDMAAGGTGIGARKLAPRRGSSFVMSARLTFVSARPGAVSPDLSLADPLPLREAR